ncbi:MULTISPECIES: DEAD/DEAH box helicase family protein [unclassified Microbacterium]|uniref:DEAD/DEAH box helicase n=1 Tax=unclassified Microbacterium TaxID=2609290 RepID=UPI0024683540|nr:MULTISPECIES: DEAD/DEAH box helicase family protein [unclassified Microbacterium]MDH5134275.1 DEAD/DEAH box helicase family protein [Microbacterium sp. RD10]MDH5138051.1 DEAD/DEAH box helicase family protein [Microbacterium sp. RD11]MDH5145464.1 DEAD/DEAH box helicase family protein [Microbacterium sp. RD12]MDH5156000.1 DEAD/DEAH box helicase family protein [Microbacterium sp. RD06]MDH5166309.1 DEAD/DEAH box helicase family protein [Microbacterium sp. RD02]
MRFTLKDYQADAVGDTLRELTSARDFYRSASRRVSSVALTATTGAGKTVMAAAVIESLFWGSDDFSIAPDPGAVVLWFSDDPALNQQTKHRLEQASDRLRNRLVTVEHPFRYQKLHSGNVYFLNTSKLSKNSLLVRGRDDSNTLPGFDSHADTVPFTFWDTLRNTIEDNDLTLYMVLDEAHRGMGKRPSETPTIVKRLINGHNDVPPVPIVWGISATVQRFEAAMSEAEVQSNRVHLATVQVDPVRIQESGLLKDDIVLDFPAETGDFNTVLLRRGVRKVKGISAAWTAYANDQNEEPVRPLMVLQVPNKPSPTEVASAIDVIRDEWPELEADAIAHVFGEHTAQTFGSHSVPYISPERVQDASYVRVLLAKDAISTGWDCPRAEVMVSFRPARDETHITQLLGRMIRTPLARRIEGDDLLNSVECILPKFNKATASLVLERIMGNDLTTGGGTGQRVLVDPQVMTPNQAVPDEVWELFQALPAETLPRKHANPIKRLTSLAHALAADRLLADAGKLAHERLHGVLNGLSAQYANDLTKALKDVQTVAGGTVRGQARHGLRQDESWTEYADDRAIQDAYRTGARSITPDIARTYVEHLAADAEDEDAYRDANVRVAALAMLPQTRPALDTEADRIAHEWLGKYRVAIKDLSESRQSLYAEITAMSTDPQLISMALPKNRQEETKRVTGDSEQLLERRALHLLADDEGMFPVGKLNPDEIEVLDAEMSRGGALAWYRNPTGGRDSMSIAYQDRHGEWRTLRPDFLFFANGEDGVRASIVDPHGHWLPDAAWKLHGMARFAEAYGDQFHRIEAISRIDGKLRVLDLKLADVRAKVLNESDARFAYDRAAVDY